MKKRIKPTNFKSREKKGRVSLARSDDSGVSLIYTKLPELSENKDVDNEEENILNNNYNLRVSLNKDNVRQFSCQNSNPFMEYKDPDPITPSEDPASEKSQFSFPEDDDLNLDYEPSEDNLEDYEDSPVNISRSPDQCDFLDGSAQNKAQKDENVIINVSERDPRPDTSKGRKNIQRTIDDHNYLESFNELIVRKNEPSAISAKETLRNCESSEVSCNELDEHDEEEFSSENDQDYGDDSATVFSDDHNYQNDENIEIEEQAEDLFKNVTFDFKGPLNITITRPVINQNVPSGETTESERVDTREASNIIPTFENVTKKLKIKHISTNIVDNAAGEKYMQKRKWPTKSCKWNLIKITSGDDIFAYNLVKYPYKKPCLRQLFSQSESSSLYMDDLEHLGKFSETSSKNGEYSDTSRSSIISPNPLGNLCSSSFGDCFLPNNSSVTSEIGSEVRNYISYSVNTSNRRCSPINTSNNRNIQENNTEDSLIGSMNRSIEQPHTLQNQQNIPASDAPSKDDEISIYGSSTIFDVASEFSGGFGTDNRRIESDKEEFVTRWLMSSDDDNFLESLCESYLTTGCTDMGCSRSHCISEIGEIIQQLPINQLNKVYKTALTNINWFEQFFEIFLHNFKKFSERGRIIDMIADIFDVFKTKFTDKTCYIMKIVRALESTGISFKEAIENIIRRYGISQIWICDILLFIISKEPNLEEHWSLVTNIICRRKEKIDHEVVTNLLLAALNDYPPNKDLCRKIHNEIFERLLVDVEKIAPTLRTSIDIVMKAMTTVNNIDTRRSRSQDSMRENYSSTSENCHQELSEFNKSLQRMLHCDIDGNYVGSNHNMNNILPHQDDYGNEELQYNNPSREKDMNLNIEYRQLHNDYLGTSGRSDLTDTTGDICSLPTRFTNDIHSTERTQQSNNPSIDKLLATNDINVRHRQILQDGIVSSDPCRLFTLNDYMMTNHKSITRTSNSSYSSQTFGDTEDTFKLPSNRAPRSERYNVSTKKPRKKEKPNDSRSIYNNEVLRKINQSLHVMDRAPTPANIIAHPDRQLVISSRFECNFSLHNLFPEIHQSAADISTSDVVRLQDAIENMNGMMFLNIMDTYCDSFTIESFILHTLTLIKSTSGVFEKFMNLLSAIEKVQPNYMKIQHIKMIVEVLAMNLVYLLETKCQWKLCRRILLKVKDWHSLLTSKIFFCHSNLMSHMHRYIYIIEILIKAEDFHWVNEIFQLDVLSLLGPVSKWPYQHVVSDVKMRNRALQAFFEKGMTSNIVTTNDLLKHIMLILGGNVTDFNVWKLFSSKIIAMLDREEESRMKLELLFRDIVNYYGQYMENDALQSYFLYMKDNVAEKEAFSLFRVCSKKGIYHRYTGEEPVVLLRTTMSDFEIKCIIKCFFENIINRQIYPHDFYIQLKLPDTDQTERLNILKERVNRSVFAVFASVIDILKVNYNITINQSVESRILVTQGMQETSLLWT